jgi:hypothetical protein
MPGRNPRSGLACPLLRSPVTVAAPCARPWRGPDGSSSRRAGRLVAPPPPLLLHHRWPPRSGRLHWVCAPRPIRRRPWRAPPRTCSAASSGSVAGGLCRRALVLPCRCASRPPCAGWGPVGVGGPVDPAGGRVDRDDGEEAHGELQAAGARLYIVDVLPCRAPHTSTMITKLYDINYIFAHKKNQIHSFLAYTLPFRRHLVATPPPPPPRPIPSHALRQSLCVSNNPN